MRKIERIGISAADRERLERLVRDRNTPQKVVWRARIVLLASDGLTAEGIAAAVDKSLLTVRRWRRRFAGVAARIHGADIHRHRSDGWPFSDLVPGGGPIPATPARAFALVSCHADGDAHAARSRDMRPRAAGARSCL